MEQNQPNRPQRLLQDSAPRRYMDAPTFLDEKGYVWEWCPSHPMTHRGMVSQHRLVIECAIGRFLTKQERVHHRNHDRSDNRSDNLELVADHATHMREHWGGKGRRDPALIARVRAAAADPTIPATSLGVSVTVIGQICEENGIVWHRRSKIPNAKPLTDETVREALQGRTTAQAAAWLGTHPQTLYKRFDHLLRKRTSPGSLEPHRAEILFLLRKERLTRAEVASRFGVSEPCVLKNAQKWAKEDGLGLPEPLLPWARRKALEAQDATSDEPAALRRPRRVSKR